MMANKLNALCTWGVPGWNGYVQS